MYGKKVKLKEYKQRVDFDINDIDPYEVFHRYTGHIPNVKKHIKSPFKQERTPSFGFYIDKSNVLKFKCFATGHGGNCIDFVSILYGIDYKEAIVKIINEVYGDKQISGNKVQSTNVYVKPLHGVFTPKADVKIEVILREWLIHDIKYWKQYGLTIDDLEKHNVYPCKQVWIYNDNMYYNYRSAKDLCYRYLINGRYKIYRPMKEGKGKWLSNMTKKDVQGFNLLPEKGELLVITKSLKDVIVLRKHLGIESISFGSESVTISKVTADYLYTRFDNIVLFYDNDEAGLINMERISKLTNIPFISISKELNTKDPADLYRDYGKEIFKDVITKLLGI
jgi:hypothetical protein